MEVEEVDGAASSTKSVEVDGEAKHTVGGNTASDHTADNIQSDNSSNNTENTERKEEDDDDGGGVSDGDGFSDDDDDMDAEKDKRSPEERLAAAGMKKEAANDAFKAGDLGQAVDQWKAALEEVKDLNLANTGDDQVRRARECPAKPVRRAPPEREEETQSEVVLLSCHPRLCSLALLTCPGSPALVR